jgi:imidazole glycerol-phosphate synthase subunit HisH
MRIDIVRTPAGNFGRLARAFERLGATPALVEPSELEGRAGPVVLAGVSTFTTLALSLDVARTSIRARLRVGDPVLGICAGFQGLFESSEEGAGRGLGLLPGTVERLRATRRPNLGWSRLEPRSDDPLLRGVAPGSYAYFAHSFRVPSVPEGVVAVTRYGEEVFPSAYRRGPLWGVQFHPELSGEVGRTVLGNFLGACQEAARCA